MKKKVRSLVALSAVAPHWLSLAVLLSFGATRGASCFGPSGRAHAQANASSAAPPTWAVQVAPDSRCASDGRFGTQIAEPIPAAQRASVENAELLANVRVVRSGGGLRASIQVFDRVLQSQAGARELELPLSSCLEIADAISLVIGVLVETGRTAAPPPVAPPPEPPPLPPTPPPDDEVGKPVEDEEPQRAPPPERKRYAWLGPKAGHDLTVQAGVGWGLLPGAYAGGTAGWGIRTQRVWPIWLTATGFLPRTTSAQLGQFSALYGGIAVCPGHWDNGRQRAQLCPSFAAGALWAEGRGLQTQRKRTEAIALVGLDLKGDFRIAGPLALSLTGRVEVPLVRQDFAYRRMGGHNGGIYEVAPLTLTVLGGLSLLFR